MLTPIPQYPLYSALTTLLNGVLVPYYLNEETGWECTAAELRRALHQARYKVILNVVIFNSRFFFIYSFYFYVILLGAKGSHLVLWWSLTQEIQRGKFLLRLECERLLSSVEAKMSA